ncbi:MAG: DUF6391 domain-containing protein [Dehalococcoidia bacterium]
MAESGGRGGPIRWVVAGPRRVVDAVRRNHALEHGAVMIMLARGRPAPSRLVGRAAPDGFYVYGRVDTDTLTGCAHEALERFHRGERSLALTPLCGTNIAVTGVLAGLAAVVTMGRRPSVDRLANVFAACTAAVVAAQPVGRWVQQHVTTRADLDSIEIVGVRRGLGGVVRKVQTRDRRDRPA